MKNLYYILKNKEIIPVDSVITWAEEFQKQSSIIKQNNFRTILGKSIFVSTVFIGINTSLNDEKPLLFETMIFGGKHDHYKVKYHTYNEAEEGHEKAVKLAKSTVISRTINNILNYFKNG